MGGTFGFDSWAARRKFLASFIRHAFFPQLLRRWVLVGTLALLVGVLALDMGAGFGLPALFWHEVMWKQALAGFSVTMLIVEVLYVGFLIDTDSPRHDLWVSKLPAGTNKDPVLVAKYYIYAALVSLLGCVVLVAAVWAVGRVLETAQLPSEVRTAGGQNLPRLHQEGSSVDWISRWPFLVGVLIATITLYAMGHGLRRLIATGWLDRFKNREWLRRLLRIPRNGRTDLNRLYGVAGVVFWVILFTFVLNMAGLPLATPASALCMLLCLLVALYGMASFQMRNASWVLGVLFLGAFLLGGWSVYKHPIHALDAYYASDQLVRTYPSTLLEGERSGMIRSVDIPWQKLTGRKRPLVLMCVSGGGIRAAVWSSAVMCELERQIPDFPYHIRMITGASGGMVGAGYYVSSLLPPEAALKSGLRHNVAKGAGDVDALQTLTRTLGKDSLSASALSLIFHDIPRFASPFPDEYDRAAALENQWRSDWGDAGNATFGALRQGEEEGWRPSLVYSPMLVEDGRRLLISNLDMSYATIETGHRLLEGVGIDDAPTERSSYGFYSRAGAEVSRMFPRAWKAFPVVTAARLSASFPYVSPAAVLPTLPRRRVVDAGYYDNYGISLAGGWLLDCVTDDVKRRWLLDNVSGVILIQVRDGASKFNEKDTQIGEVGPGRIGMETQNSSPAARALESLSSPIEGVLAARDAVAVFRNDHLLQELSERFNQLNEASQPKGGPPGQFDAGYFTTATIEFDGEAPLSWYLTTDETQRLMDAINPTAKPQPKAVMEVEAVRSWWATRLAK